MDTASQGQLTQIQQQLAELAQQSASRHEALQQQVVQSASDRSELKHQLGVLAQLISASQPKLDSAPNTESVMMSIEGCGSIQSGASKRARIAFDGTSALYKDVILDEVFSYVGIKDYIYAAGVCRQGRVRYLRLCYSKAASTDQKDKLRTSFESAARTTARLQVALDSGLTVVDLEKNQHIGAGALARCSWEPMATLTLARTYGLRWTEDYTRCAAARNDLQLLQWLLRCGCECTATGVAFWARQHGNLDMLKCSHAAAPLHNDIKSSILALAGQSGQLSTLQWLREISAAWPDRFYGELGETWTVPAVQWALANGCTWGSWKCQLAKPAKFYCAVCGRTPGEHNDAECTVTHCKKRQAAALYAWAHEHGCPCSCGDPSSPVERHDSGDSDNDSDDSSVNDG
eukprot:6936-Heterococcus_DN1.PRE.2